MKTGTSHHSVLFGVLVLAGMIALASGGAGPPAGRSPDPPTPKPTVQPKGTTPMLTGRQLIKDIDECSPAKGELAIWWLGQHSFIVKIGKTVIYLDPFLTPMKSRQVAPLLAPEEILNADLICGSHDHIDHIDRPVWPALAKACPRAKFVVPDLLREKLARGLKIPTDRFVGIDDGNTVDLDGIRITGVAAAHELLDQDPATGKYPYMGYVIEAGGCTLYHSGDCCIYEGLQTKLKKWKFDVVFLPINGRDAKRLASGCIGNMTYQEGADLAGALAPRLTIPAHWDMFANNPGDPNAFADYMRVKYPKLAVQICRHGQRVTLPAKSAK
jgi:L-ascorbate metabolism protein UlaG (beta-lactamase superfamily)